MEQTKNTVNIEYIGWRPNHKDKYANLFWTHTGFVQPVPGSKAQKMLARHPDVYRLAENETAENLADAVEADTDDHSAVIEEMRDIEAHALRNEVSRMDKQNLVQFAHTKFGIKLDQRRAVDALRKDVINHIDIYGVA